MTTPLVTTPGLLFAGRWDTTDRAPGSRPLPGLSSPTMILFWMMCDVIAESGRLALTPTSTIADIRKMFSWLAKVSLDHLFQFVKYKCRPGN